MKASNKTLTFADETVNIYRLTKEEYDKIQNYSTTTSYKKASNNIKKKIRFARMQVLRENKVLKRMQINEENNCFISLKDHKENSQNNASVRLINPAKSGLGKNVNLGNIKKNIGETLEKTSTYHQTKNISKSAKMSRIVCKYIR